MERIILCLGIFSGLVADVNARDLGQWGAVDPKIREWYQALMQPDVPNASCCGEADAYWADEVHVRDGKTYAVITDDRPDDVDPHEVADAVEVMADQGRPERARRVHAGARQRAEDHHDQAKCRSDRQARPVLQPGRADGYADDRMRRNVLHPLAAG